MYFYKKVQKYPIQIALYKTWSKFKKCLKNWFRPLGVNHKSKGIFVINMYFLHVPPGNYKSFIVSNRASRTTSQFMNPLDNYRPAPRWRIYNSPSLVTSQRLYFLRHGLDTMWIDGSILKSERFVTCMYKVDKSLEWVKVRNIIMKVGGMEAGMPRAANCLRRSFKKRVWRWVNTSACIHPEWVDLSKRWWCRRFWKISLRHRIIPTEHRF